MSSQYGEDKIIHGYFGDKRDGRFLDLGAYDGREFSNTFALAEKGWTGVCVEASPQCFVQLQKTYDQNPNIILVNAAIDESNGCSVFYDNGGALATLSKAHTEKWKGLDCFKKMYVATITPEKLLAVLPGPYDFVSVDIEGKSLSVLALFPSLQLLGVKLICVEVYLPEEQKILVHMMDGWGFTFVDKTEENWIFKVI